MELGYRVATNLTRGTIVVRHAFGALLEASTNNRCLVIHFTDDEDG